MHEYDFFAFLRGLSEAQARHEQKTIAAQKGPTPICGEDRRGDLLPLRESDGGTGGPAEPVAHEGSTADHLRSLLEFLGED